MSKADHKTRRRSYWKPRRTTAVPAKHLKGSDFDKRENVRVPAARLRGRAGQSHRVGSAGPAPRLGAGAFLKKPYSLHALGRALWEELAKPCR